LSFWLGLFRLMAAYWSLAPLAGLVLAAGLLIVRGRPLLAPLRRFWEFQADAFAAAQVGGETMAAALERLEEINGAPSSPPSSFHPALQDRLRRLRSP
jgi:Zn-dependent protease with chaperone function